MTEAKKKVVKKEDPVKEVKEQVVHLEGRFDNVVKSLEQMFGFSEK